LYEHVRAIRENKWLSDAFIVLFVERNTGHESGHLANMLKRNFDKVAFYHQPPTAEERRAENNMHLGLSNMRQFEEEYLTSTERNPGFTTNIITKGYYRSSARTMLSTGAVMWMEGAFSADPLCRDETKKAIFTRTKESFYDQMSRATNFNKRSTSELSFAKTSWSAKCDHEGKRQDGYEDDLIITFAVACYLWPKAMSGELLGFPYSKVDLSYLNEDFRITENRKIQDTRTFRNY